MDYKSVGATVRANKATVSWPITHSQANAAGIVICGKLKLRPRYNSWRIHGVDTLETIDCNSPKTPADVRPSIFTVRPMEEPRPMEERRPIEERRPSTPSDVPAEQVRERTNLVENEQQGKILEDL